MIYTIHSYNYLIVDKISLTVFFKKNDSIPNNFGFKNVKTNISNGENYRYFEMLQIIIEGVNFNQFEIIKIYIQYNNSKFKDFIALKKLM